MDDAVPVCRNITKASENGFENIIIEAEITHWYRVYFTKNYSQSGSSHVDAERSIPHLEPLLIIIPFKHWEVCDPQYFMGSLFAHHNKYIRTKYYSNPAVALNVLMA
jgi:hypothetical protein